MKHLTSYIAAAMLSLAACTSPKEGWSVEGEGAPDSLTVTLEMPSAVGGWYVADSAKVSSQGSYSITRPRAKGEIYRLNIGGRYIYLPADSTETIHVDAAGRLSGSPEALLFNSVDSVLALPADSLSDRRILQVLDGNYGSTAAYYATLRLQGSNRRLLRAVANVYKETRPNDLRTLVLLAQIPEAQPAQTELVVDAPEVGYFDFELMNRHGKMVSLSSVVDASPRTLLCFIDFTDDALPAMHLALGDLLTRSPGTAIFEVGLAPNQHVWADATSQLRWTNVYQSDAAPRTHLRQYNIPRLPAFFLIENGQVTRRLFSPDELQSL